MLYVENLLAVCEGRFDWVSKVQKADYDISVPNHKFVTIRNFLLCPLVRHPGCPFWAFLLALFEVPNHGLVHLVPDLQQISVRRVVGLADPQRRECAVIHIQRTKTVAHGGHDHESPAMNGLSTDQVSLSPQLSNRHYPDQWNAFRLLSSN